MSRGLFFTNRIPYRPNQLQIALQKKDPAYEVIFSLRSFFVDNKKFQTKEENSIEKYSTFNKIV